MIHFKLIAFLLVAQMATPNAALQNAHRLFEARRFPEAITAYKSIIANYPSSPETPVAAYYIGLSEERRGGRQAALAAHQAMVAKYPSSDLARFSKQRIIELQADLEKNPSGTTPTVVEQPPRPRPTTRPAASDMTFTTKPVVTPPPQFPSISDRRSGTSRNSNAQFPQEHSEQVSVVNYGALTYPAPAPASNPRNRGVFPSAQMPIPAPAPTPYDESPSSDQSHLSITNMNTTYIRRPMPDAHGEADVSISVTDADVVEASPSAFLHVPTPFEGISLSGMVNPYQLDRGSAIAAPPVTSWLASSRRTGTTGSSVEEIPRMFSPPATLSQPQASPASSLLEESGQPSISGAWEPRMPSAGVSQSPAASIDATLPIMPSFEPAAEASVLLPITQTGIDAGASAISRGGASTSRVEAPIIRTQQIIPIPQLVPAQNSLDPAEAHIRRGIDFRKLGMDEKAIEEYQKALEIAPNGPLAPIAKNNLADIYAERGENLSEAIKILTEALMLDLPDKGPYYSTLGWAYAKLGDYENAEKFLNESMKTTITASRLYRRGRLYATMGMPAKARADLDRASVYSEDAAMSALIRKALESLGAEASPGR